MRLKVGFDVDGVLADFKSAFRAVAVEVVPRLSRANDAVLTQQEVARVWDVIARTHNWWTELRAYEPEQIARLYESVRSHQWEVVFVTNRPASSGDSAQLQTQWWLEQNGFLLPAVVTVPGSRGDVANALRLDLMVDDQPVNCAEIVGGSTTKALLLLRDGAESVRQHALSRGIGVVSTLSEALDVIDRMREALPQRRGRLMRLGDWFFPPAASGPPLAVQAPRPSLTDAPSPAAQPAGAPQDHSLKI